MKMYKCLDCGFFQEENDECIMCESDSMEEKEATDEQLLQQEQMLKWQTGIDDIPSKFENAKSIIFLGATLNPKEYPMVWQWAMKNAWTLQEHMEKILSVAYEGNREGIPLLVANIENDLAMMTSENRKIYLASKEVDYEE